MKNTRLRLLSYFVILYMLVAFAWWSILLFTKNRDAYSAKIELMKIGMVAQGIADNEAEFKETAAYQALSEKYKRQEWMILGEACVFVISLVIGVWLINRGYNKEMTAAQQSRNFLLSITHELKSPIASIRLVLETFLKRDLNKEQIDKFSGNALVETERLNNLVNNLLLAAKLETAYEPVLEDINISELVEEIVEKMKVKFPSVQFLYTEKTALPPRIKADRFGLSSVTINLLENAVKYATENIRIETILSVEKNQVHLDITDNGIGIPDQEKKNVFGKFYRIGNEDTRKTKGTGLGLYIVNEIIKAHKGTIEVKNNLPKGTIFSIAFPVQ